ncbi:MAG TPA: Rrf2 family transcriptional regulator [Planctomycetaceae bacterium]|nr:Rrf2 family transcriptional regulator [Planctomycetaceae bacterium]
MAVGQIFSQRFSYGLHALAYVATKPAGELTTLPELGRWMKTIWPSASEAYLSNVVQQLTRGKLLRSHRGIAGGYSLARAANKITVRDVVEILEGVDINRCGLSLGDECPVMGRCSIQRRIAQLEEGFLRSLERVNVAQLAKEIVTTPPKKAPAKKKRVKKKV